MTDRNLDTIYEHARLAVHRRLGHPMHDAVRLIEREGSDVVLHLNSGGNATAVVNHLAALYNDVEVEYHGGTLPIIRVRDVPGPDPEEASEPGLFPAPDPQPTPVTRPDGRVYRPKLLPEVVIVSDDGEIEGCMVMRTHSLDVANRLAAAAMREYVDGPTDTDQDVVDQLSKPTLVWGKWRPDRFHDRVWEQDDTGRTGTPAVSYRTEWAP